MDNNNNKKRTKLLAICGPSACGKDTLVKTIIEKTEIPLNKIIQCTTRPPREKERNGKDYIFFSPEEAINKLFADKFLEMTDFRGWQYGTLKESLNPDLINIGIYNPSAILTIEESLDEIDLLVIYITAEDKIRIKRSLNREKEPDIEEIFRRYKEDKKDWAHFESHLELKNNNNEDMKRNVKILLELIRKWECE